MSTEYEPGTVAIATVRRVPNVRVFVTLTQKDGSLWRHKEIDGHWASHDSDVTDIRPLVVLDLDRPDLLHDLIECARSYDTRADPDHPLSVLADQIEAQTKPPRIPEPTGLGAVVKDIDGDTWVRTSDVVTSHHNYWLRKHSSYTGSDCRKWTGLHAVEVISEGVR